MSDCHAVEDLIDENAALRARIAELESALRLHLAVDPKDPLLLTPAEQLNTELLEALKALLDTPSQNIMEQTESFRKARQAIAKAEGNACN